MEPVFADFDIGLCEDLRYAKVSQQEISCKAGCAYCCEQAIMLSLPEAALIVGNHRAVVEEVKPELLRQEELLRGPLQLTAEVLDIYDTSPSTTLTREAFHKRYWDTRIPCAFLDRKTKVCRVYESRPLTCRAHIVTTDPSLCSVRPADGQPSPKVQTFNPPFAYDRALRSIYQISQETLGSPTTGLLPVLVLSALETSK